MGCNSSKPQSNLTKRNPASPPPPNRQTKPDAADTAGLNPQPQQLNIAPFSPILNPMDAGRLSEVLTKHFSTCLDFLIVCSHIGVRLKKKALLAKAAVAKRHQQEENKELTSSQVLIGLQQQQQPESREAKIRSGMILIEQRLTHLGLKQVEMKDDGNCQFRSIAHQLYGDQERHLEIRAAAVHHFETHRADFNFLFENAEEAKAYIDEMRTPKTWGDELTLKMICEGLGVTIHVVSSTGSNYYHKYVPAEEYVQSTAECGSPTTKQNRGAVNIFLGYISPIHYNSIVL
eukprot:PhF_6_TR13225/c0_g1_i1/m.20914